jgi:hypothetical protein
MAAVNNYDKEDALALFDFHESCVGVRGVVESDVTKVLPPFQMPTASISSAAMEALVAPSIDLTLPRSHVAHARWRHGTLVPLLPGYQPWHTD